MFPFTYVGGSFVEAKKAGHPICDFRTDRKKFTMEMTTQFRFPISWWMEAMVVTGGKVNYAMIKAGALFLLFNGIRERLVLTWRPIGSEEGFKAISHTFDLFKMRFTSHRPIMKDRAITRRDNAIGRDESTIFSDLACKELRQTSVMPVGVAKESKFC